MHRFTTKRVPLWLAASALLASATLIGANQNAQAAIQDPLPINALCIIAAPTAATPVPPGYERIIGTAGNDDGITNPMLKGSSANEVIWGLAGNDIIKGGGGDDIICAGAGRDEIKGGGGGTNYLHAIGDPAGPPPPAGGVNPNDTIKGGSGVDFVYADAVPAGTDLVRAGSGNNFMCDAADVCTPMP